jgi:uncharacterized RDD family membrane protein YckC
MKRYTIVRALAAVIDVIIIYVPSVVLFNTFLVHQIRYADLMAQAVFALYNIVAVTGFHGQTIGKYFARLRVDTSQLMSQRTFFAGMREVAKLLYFTPIIGVPLIGINLLVCLVTGKMLEDYIGQTAVVINPNGRVIKP